MVLLYDTTHIKNCNVEDVEVLDVLTTTRRLDDELTRFSP